MAPMKRIVEILDVMRTGDLSGRLDLARKDEFNAVETVHFSRSFVIAAV